MFDDSETNWEVVILATVSSDPGFHGAVRAVLDGRFRFEDVWDLDYEDAARLRGVKSDQQCLNVVDFTDPSRAFPMARTLSTRPQIATIAVNARDGRDELLLMMQAGIRDVLLRAKRVLLVGTPDIGALHVARRKSQWFRDLRLTDKVSLVLNCMERRDTLSVQDIEQVIQLPVRYLLPAASKDISRAVEKGAILDPSCPLGRQVAAIARDMVPVQSVVRKPSPVRRFGEYFSVSPARERAASKSQPAKWKTA